MNDSTVHQMFRIRRALGALGALGALALAAAAPAVQAQQSRTPSSPRARTVMVTAGGRCSALTSSPTTLLEAPEGRALLRFKRELNDAAGVIEQRSDSTSNIDIQRITRMQRGVDSLMRIVVRYKKPDGSDGEIVTLQRGDTMSRLVDGHRLQPGMLFLSMENTLRSAAPVLDSTLRMIAPNIEAAIRSLQPQVAAFSDAARMRLPMRVAAPSGWLGMHLSESKITIMSDEGALTNYCDYPVIEAVDAGSPAEQSGLNAGDTVVAYNGRDVMKTAVNYSELLVPGQVLRMRVKRASRFREVPVTVAARPSTERNVAFYRAPCRPGATCERSPGQFTYSTTPMGPPPPPVLAPSFSVEAMAASGMAVLAGAQLSLVDEELAQGIGVDGPGALVLRAPAGTPAADAGLRAGDVIRAVNGSPVREMVQLRRAFSANGSREVRLTVSSRGAPPRIVTVKW